MTDDRRPLRDLADALRRRELLTGGPGDAEVPVRGVAHDSREVAPGDVFVAWRGARHDGHDFVRDAVDAGAVAAVVERPVEGVPAPQLRVGDGRRAAAVAADWWYGSPWRELEMVAVTGTNGKTTTAALTRHLLAADTPAASMGTLGVVGTDGRVRPGSEGLTTPGPVDVARWLATLAAEGVGAVVVEASSHALDQQRLDGVRFDAGAFTNFSRDHLDYHDGPGGYFRAKARLVELLEEGAAAVVNADDPAWGELPDHRGPTVTFSVEGDGDVRARGVQLHPGGARFHLTAGGADGEEDLPVELPLVGRFNVENAVAASATARALGRELDAIARELSRAPQVPGRLERVAGGPCPVYVDFAHTPDALERVLDALRPFVRGRIVLVFGAGGDRDRGKRPRMGRIAQDGADIAIVTSDNPRTEDPDAIVDGIVAGMDEGRYERIVDRRRAIARALEVAAPGDAVLLAGKGHERYQEVGGTRRPFDEAAIVRELLADAGGSR